MKYLIKNFNPLIHKNLLIDLWFSYLFNPSEQRYSLLYENNDVSRMQTVLLFLEKGEKMLGCASVLLYNPKFMNDNLVLGINVDMIVERKHRSLGPAIFLLKNLVANAKESGVDALLAIPNQASLPVFKRTGYKCAGKLCRYVKILNIKKKIKDKFRHKVIRDFLAGIINFFIQCFSCEIVHPMRFFLSGRRFKLLLAENFPDDFKLDESERIFLSDVYMKWRYRIAGVKGYKKCFFYENEQLRAILIYRLIQQEIVIEKMFAVSFKDLENMLYYFIKEMRKNKNNYAINLTYFGNNKIKHIFKRFGFLRREDKKIMFMPFSEKAAGLLAVEDQWDIYESDLDL